MTAWIVGYVVGMVAYFGFGISADDRASENSDHAKFWVISSVVWPLAVVFLAVGVTTMALRRKK